MFYMRNLGDVGLFMRAYIAAGALLLMASFLIRNAQFRETFRYTMQGISLYPLFYFAIIDSNSPLFRWLNWRPVRFLGELSYSLYLVHFSVILGLRNWFPDSPELLSGLLGFPIAIAISINIYYLLERPCARLRKRLHV
jgi:peptidoglycan/LPS O-acetylase OafA/YrhL